MKIFVQELYKIEKIPASTGPRQEDSLSHVLLIIELEKVIRGILGQYESVHLQKHVGRTTGILR